MRLAIIGTKYLIYEDFDFDLTDHIPRHVNTIVLTGIKSLDLFPEKFADAHKFSKIIVKPQNGILTWINPIKRNKAIIDNADYVFAFWDCKSIMVKYSVLHANKALKLKFSALFDR